jgi:transcriptional regulator with XRE-family HTH domain
MIEFDAQDVGERLHILRRRRGFTLPEVSAQTGINPITLSRLEHGQMPQVSCALMMKLAQVFEVSMDTLLGMPAKATSKPRAKSRKAASVA